MGLKTLKHSFPESVKVHDMYLKTWYRINQMHQYSEHFRVYSELFFFSFFLCVCVHAALFLKKDIKSCMGEVLIAERCRG